MRVGRVTTVPPLPAVTRVPAQAATGSLFALAFFLSAAGLLALLAVILFVTAPWVNVRWSRYGPHW